MKGMFVIKFGMATSDTVKKPYKQMANDQLPAIIERDVGKGAKLLSWESVYFTNKGQHFIGKVKHVICKISYNKTVIEKNYIVKVNPRRSIELFQIMTNSFFVKESIFLNEIAPQLNKILKAASCVPLNVPECIFVSLEKHNEVILFNDLRQDNYRVHDRLDPLDLPHVMLFAKEIAKLHAASYVLHVQQKWTDLKELYPLMQDFWLHEENPGSTQYIRYCNVRFESAINALENQNKYAKVLTWLKREQENLFQYFVNSWEQSDDKFKTICHGDCWTSNMMFRYDETGSPCKIILLDYQQCRVASLATDIHIFLITTTTGELRKKYLETFLQTYYKSFCDVFHGVDVRVPFSYQELKEEYLNKLLFECLAGIIKLPLVLADENEAIDFNILDTDALPKFFEYQKRFLDRLFNSEVTKRRFLSVFDDAMMNGLFT